MSQTRLFGCEKRLVGVKTTFSGNLTFFHSKRTGVYTKVWCELNPCFFLMRGSAMLFQVVFNT
jgi:hypothetical protein